MRTLRIFTRLIVVVCAGAIALQSYTLWRETRIEGYTFTRYYDQARAQQQRDAKEESLADLFEGTGLEDNTGAMEEIPNRFMLGLLPAGAGRDAVSLLTLAGPALLVMLFAAMGIVGEVFRKDPRTACGPGS